MTIYVDLHTEVANRVVTTVATDVLDDGEIIGISESSFQGTTKADVGSRIADTFTESLASAAHPGSPVIILEEPELGLHPYAITRACSARLSLTTRAFSLLCRP